MLAAALLLALTLGAAPAGARDPAAPRRPHAARGHTAPGKAAPAKAAPLAASGDNRVRARRGLLPRKERRAPLARARPVYRAPPPVWLDAPGMPDAEPTVVPASAAGVALPEEVADGLVHAALEAARVEILLVRRRTDGEGGPLVEATVEGAMVDALILRWR